jgi:hypothetical protein
MGAGAQRWASKTRPTLRDYGTIRPKPLGPHKRRPKRSEVDAVGGRCGVDLATLRSPPHRPTSLIWTVYDRPSYQQFRMQLRLSFNPNQPLGQATILEGELERIQTQ